MKKTFAIALALVLVVSCCCAIFASAEGSDFAVKLSSKLDGSKVTVTLTVDTASIGTGVHMEALNATLKYDAERLTLTNEISSANNSVKCATKLPTGEEFAWENVTKVGENDGEIIISFGATDEIVELDANHPIELTFTFEFKSGYKSAVISVENVTSYYVPDRTKNDTVDYVGQGATITVGDASASTPSESTPSDTPSESTPSTSTPSESTPSDTNSGSTDSGEAPAGSDSTTSDPASSPETGDMGVIWFAMLALVAVAGVAVAAKVRH